MWSPASSAQSSVQRPVLRQPFRPESCASSSVERSVLRKAPCHPLSVPSYEERSVLRWASCPPSGVPSYEERSVFRRALLPPSTDLGSKSVESPVSSVRVPLCPRYSGQKRTSAVQIIAAHTDRVLRQAFQAMFTATTQCSVLAIAGRDTPAPGRSEQPKPQEKINRNLQVSGKGKTSKRQEIATY